MQVIWALIGFILTLLTYYVFKFYDESTQNKRRGIIYLGNGLSKVFYKSVKGITHCDYLLEQYSRIKRVRQKFGVGSEFSAKTFFITDLSVIKDICIKKFDHFVNRRCVVSDSDIFIPKMLMAKQGDDWKEVRSKLNQIFIPSRLSGMFPLMDKSSKKLVNYFESQVDSPYSDVETGISKLTMDVFASLAFGMESEAFQNPEKRSNFEEMAAKLPGSLSLSNIFKLCFLHLFPRLAKCLKLSLYSSEAQRYFEKSIKNVITQRTEEKAVSSGSSSEDFLQLMLNLRDAGLPIEVVDQLIKGQPEKKFTFSSKYDTRSKSDKQIAKCELKDEDIVAHCISFILGGYDYTVSLQLFALYNLAMHEEVQEEVHREIVEVLENADSQHFPLDLDVINRLDLLNGLLFETLRLYPPSPSTDRVCTKDYMIPGSDVIIRKGDAIEIPIFPIHMDEDYFTNSRKFDLKRFSGQCNNKTRENHLPTFIPYGYGPRSCIGMKLSLNLVKVVLVRILLRYKIQTTAKTPKQMNLAICKTVLPGERMFLKLSHRN